MPSGLCGHVMCFSFSVCVALCIVILLLSALKVVTDLFSPHLYVGEKKKVLLDAKQYDYEDMILRRCFLHCELID